MEGVALSGRLWLAAPTVGLGITQIVGFGTLTYAYTIVLPAMAGGFGWTLSGTFATLSVALFLGGLAAPLAGVLIDRFGGRLVLTVGSGMAAVALAGLAAIDGRAGLFAAVVAAEFAAMFVLYDAAFAAVAQIREGQEARRAITNVTLLGGFASTVFWPLTLALTEAYGWRVAMLVFAAMHLVICLPIHAVVLGGARSGHGGVVSDRRPVYPPLEGVDRRRGMIWMVISVTVSGYVFGAIMVHWVTALTSMGLTAAAAVAAGALTGPAKVAGRFIESAFGGRLHPLQTAVIGLCVVLFAFLSLWALGVTPVTASIFAILFGMGDGLRAIVRGTLPLALFGPEGYGARLGWVSLIRMGANASAPFAFAAVIEAYGGGVAFALMAVCTATGLAALAGIPRQGKETQ